MKPKRDVSADIMAAINKGWKGAAISLGQGSRSDVKEVIPTGIDVLDKYVLGCGGLPVGRISEIYSAEGVGKTSFGLACMASAQRMGGVAILLETEVALDSSRAKTFGCDLDKVILLQPGHLPEVGQMTELAIKSIPHGTGPVLIVWDSIAATPSQEEVDEGLAEAGSFDKRAKGCSQAMRALAPLLAKHRAHFLMVNQIRDKIGVMFGDKTSTPGGHAPKFHSSVRMQLFGGKAVKDTGGHTGKTVTFMATKNKLSVPYRKAQVRLDYAKGWDNEWTSLNHAKEMKLIAPLSRDYKAAVEALNKAKWVGSSSDATEESDEDDTAG